MFCDIDRLLSAPFFLDFLACLLTKWSEHAFPCYLVAQDLKHQLGLPSGGRTYTLFHQMYLLHVKNK